MLLRGLPVDLLPRDTDVAELWLEDKIEHTAHWHSFRGVIRQLEAIGVPDPMQRSKPPAFLFALRCRTGETRVFTEGD